MKPKTVGKTLTAISILFIIASIIFTPQIKAIHHYKNAEPPQYTAPVPTIDQYKTQYSPLVDNLFTGDADPEKYYIYASQVDFTNSINNLVDTTTTTKQIIERLNKHNAFDNQTTPTSIISHSIESLDPKNFTVHKTYHYSITTSFDHPAKPATCDVAEKWLQLDDGIWRLEDTGYNQCVDIIDSIVRGGETQLNSKATMRENDMGVMSQYNDIYNKPGMKSFAPEHPFAPYGSEFSPLTSGEFFEKKPGLFDMFK